MEQNNIEQNQIQPPVEGVKKQNNNIGLIVILVLIIIALVGYIIYKKVSENTETPVVNNNVSTKNDDIKNESDTENVIYDAVTYKIEEIEVLKFKSYYLAGEGTYKHTKPYTYLVKYPVISGGDDSVKSLNEKIKNNVEQFVTQYKNSGVNLKDYKSTTAEVYEDENGKKIAYRNKYLEYAVGEDEDFITISEIIYDKSEATYESIKNDMYIIDKSNKKEITNDEFIKKIKNIEELKKGIITYITDKECPHFWDWEESEIEEYSLKIKNKLDNNKFTIKISYDYEGMVEYDFIIELEEEDIEEYTYNKNTEEWSHLY